MSIRARTSTKDNRQGGGARRRTGGLLPRRERPTPAAPEAAPQAPAPPPAAPAAEAAGKDLTDERRLRESGGPEDRQLYTCDCGFTWRGAVTASAACPHCGTGQAW
jgi:hypothetical protein